MRGRAGLLASSCRTLIIGGGRDGLFRGCPRVFRNACSMPVGLLGTASSRGSVKGTSVIRAKVMEIANGNRMALRVGFRSVRFTKVANCLCGLGGISVSAIRCGGCGCPMGCRTSSTAALRRCASICSLFGSGGSRCCSGGARKG